MDPSQLISTFVCFLYFRRFRFFCVFFFLDGVGRGFNSFNLLEYYDSGESKWPGSSADFENLEFSLVFKHLPRDPANVNAWKTMFDPILIFLRLTKVFKDTLFDRVGRAP